MLAEHREHVERVDAFNARRGDLPFIVDAETRIRSIPGKVTPAIKETRKVWVGTDGKPCSEYTVDAEGRQVRRQGVPREMREFVIRGELPAVATMPTRFADALVLVDIAGRSRRPRLVLPPTSPDQLRRQSSVELAIAIALLSDRVDRLCENSDGQH